jgi:hypothetical protein
MKKIIPLLLLCFISTVSFSQTVANYSATKKGQIYIMWGWNREAYTKSNISFSGSDYGFKLSKVKAHDRFTPISYHNYLQLNRMTIPQTNFRLGYFVRNNMALSFGIDHMKYVMDQNQTVKMKGSIQQAGNFKGNYDGDKVLTEDFLTFEHTDGLNYLNVEGEKFMRLYHSASQKCNIDAAIGVGIGLLMPKTNVKLLNYERNDRFHVSGLGVDVKAAIQGTFFKHLVVKLENKYGYIFMPNIILHKKGIVGRAKQNFFFTAIDIMIGGSFTINSKNRNTK